VAKPATDAVKAARIVPANRLPLVAILVGVALGLLASLALYGATTTAAVVGTFAGIVGGAGAVGLTETHKAVRKRRSYEKPAIYDGEPHD
jgi:uncharacterized membrane protein YeaQ/YmgE (transglycosylase-associated protein family)